MGLIDSIQEERGEPLRAAAIASAFADDPALCDRLAAVAAGLRTLYLTDKGWRFRVHEASLTFQQFHNRHRAVKVLIDLNNELAGRAGIAVGRNPIVIGIELTYANPVIRQALRDYLAEHYGEYYLDPRAPRADSFHFISNDKYWIAPHNDHFYDILFLPPGRLPFKADAGVEEEYRRRIVSGIHLPRQLRARL